MFGTAKGTARRETTYCNNLEDTVVLFMEDNTTNTKLF